LAAHPDASADVVLVDVFAGARTPAHLTTVEFARDVARVLRPGGVTAWNVSDGPPLRFVKAEAATLRAVFGHVALLAEPGTLRGRRFGNTVAVASDAELPIAGLTRRCAGDPMPSRVVGDEELDRFVGQAAVVTDADAQPSPQPPAGIFG
ncbi:spermidine synthase, partial [Modestobacter versicolor]